MSDARTSHVPGLDGLRGFAILAVILAHVFERVPPGQGVDAAITGIGKTGRVGVDLFFVLSGFLITGILLDQRGHAGYFRIFYARRVLRIVPVYVVFLLFSMWIAPLVGVTTPAIAQLLRSTQGWYWTYQSNVWDISHPFQPDGIPAHLWSLAVEEQFYLLWPVAVALIAPRTLPRVALACVVAAELCRIAVLASGAGPRVNYHLLPTRMDTLAIGAFLACAVRDPDLTRALARWRIGAIAGAIALLGASLILHRSGGEPLPVTQLFAFPAITLVCGVLVLMVVQSPTLLTSRSLRFFGRYSYGMYIWHLLALHVLLERTRVLTPYRLQGSYLTYYIQAVAVTLGVSVLVALVSWHLIEQPFLRLKRYVPYLPASAAAQPLIGAPSIASSGSG
jgi:peptidoglycan/LPS O-acetylase OafA/YrhL